MIFKNSLKLFVANFSVFWKLLLYKLVAIGLCALLLIPVYGAWADALTSVHFGTLFTDFAANTVFTNATVFMRDLFYVINAFIDSLGVLAGANLFAFIYSLVVVAILLPFLFGLSSVPTGESLYSYMASLNRSGFLTNFVLRIKASALYSLIRTFIWLPFKVVFVVCVYYILQMATLEGLITVFSPIIMVAFVVISLAIMTTIFSGLMPAIVVFNKTPSKAFKKAFIAVYRVFLRVLSCLIVLYFGVLMLSFMLTAYSLFALIPLTTVSVIMLQMVMFFESQGMRYYVDLDTIVSPRTLEHCDKIKKVKDII